jgi:hypothetical protein
MSKTTLLLSLVVAQLALSASYSVNVAVKIEDGKQV